MAVNVLFVSVQSIELESKENEGFSKRTVCWSGIRWSKESKGVMKYASECDLR